jgi:phosphoribosylanthranilate isomerase
MSVIKICGLTRVDDALFASQLGADYLGLVFHRPSKRFVNCETATALANAVRASDSHPQMIGVFVDEPINLILKTVETVGMDGVQLHGSSNPSAVADLQARGLLVIRGHRVAGSEDVDRLDALDEMVHLLDSHVPGLPGGTGMTFDWSLAAHVALKHRILLAGGLTATNVACAIEIVRPWGVDVSSGVEASPGVKDADKIREFIAAARTAFEVEGGRDGQER